MVLDATANFVRGSTDSSVAIGDTTISVTDASIFPDPSSKGEYNLVIWDSDTHPRPDQDADAEIVRVTGRDTNNDSVTVTRAQESTSDSSHPSGSAMQLSPTAKMFGDIETTFGNFWDENNTELTARVNNGTVETNDLQGIEPVVYDPGITNWQDGLVDEEIDRIVLQSGETFVVERIEFRQKGGGTSASASIDVRDTGAGVTVGSQNLGGTTKDPGSSNAGNTILIRLSNGTGSSIDAVPRVFGYITGV